MRKDAHVESRDNWQAVADDWECPGCGRAKVDVIRPTSKSNHYRFTAQRRSFMPEAGDSKQRPTVCGDCWETGISIGKEACEVAGAVRGEYLSLVQLSEVRAIVRPKPHGRHNIDPVAAQRVIATVAARIEAEDAAAFDINWD